MDEKVKINALQIFFRILIPDEYLNHINIFLSIPQRWDYKFNVQEFQK